MTEQPEEPAPISVWVAPIFIGVILAVITSATIVTEAIKGLMNSMPAHGGSVATSTDPIGVEERLRQIEGNFKSIELQFEMQDKIDKNIVSALEAIGRKVDSLKEVGVGGAR